MDAKREVTSPTNLREYIPNYSHFENSQRFQKQELDNSSYSYRQSLEKKLEKLFKEERRGFNESRFSADNEVPRNYGISVPTREAFTIEKMENKISELEKKYLHSEPMTEENRNLNKGSSSKHRGNSREPKKHQMIEQTEQILNRKAKGIDEYNKTRNNASLVCVEQKHEIKSNKKLLAEIDELKKEIKWIKKSNVSLNQKMEMKESEKERKRERSKYLLNSILNKLIDIQEEVQRRDERELRKHGGKPIPIMTAAEERKFLKESNFDLQKQIGELNKQLRIEVNQKEIAEERSKWMEEEIRKIGKD